MPPVWNEMDNLRVRVFYTQVDGLVCIVCFFPPIRSKRTTECLQSGRMVADFSTFVLESNDMPTDNLTGPWGVIDERKSKRYAMQEQNTIANSEAVGPMLDRAQTALSPVQEMVKRKKSF